MAISSTNRSDIYTYTPLIRSEEMESIKVILSPQKKLCGEVIGKTCRKIVPIKGLPNEIKACKDPDLLKAFFSGAHMHPIKGMKGTYTHLSVHPSLRGGMKAKIPFQPGLALGSVVKAECIKNMQKYAEKTAKIEKFENFVQTGEKRIKELQAKIDSENKKQDKKNESLITIWQNQIDAINKSIKALSKDVTGLVELPFFENFQATVQSPIDQSRSRIEVQPRGFDTLSYSSQYIRMAEDSSEIHDKMTQSSRAGSANVSYGGWFASGQSSATWARGAADRVAQIRKKNTTEAVLVINAMVTTRNVRVYTEIAYNETALQNILSVMNSGKEKNLSNYGISVDDDGNKSINILTEAVLGGSFTGIITFFKEDKGSRDMQNHSRESQFSSSSQVRGRGFFTNYSAGYSSTSQNASRSEDDVIKNTSNTNIDIEIFSQGAIPTFAREVVERELLKHLDLNPSKFELSKKDEANIKDLISSNSEKRLIANEKRRIKMENAQVAVLNTYRGLISEKEQQTVHTPSSVMTAYDSFSEKMVNDADCGIPVGFNYTILTKKNIEKLLKSNKTDKTTKNNKTIENKNKKLPNNAASSSQQGINK